MIKSNNGGTSNHDTLNDLDSEEAALHEFDFLSGDAATSANINELKSNGKRSTNQIEVFFHLMMNILDSNTNEWDVDQSRLNRLKEEYKRDRHVKHPSNSSASSALRNSLLNNGNDETSSDQRTFTDDERSMFIDRSDVFGNSSSLF